MNIYEKLVEIRKSVPYIKKGARGFGYVYVDEMSVLEALRPKMDELGVLLEVDMDEPRVLSESLKKFSEGEEYDKKMKKEIPFKSESMQYIFQVGINFTFINSEAPNEKVHKTIYMQETAGDPKILGGLLTYATRFFLTKYFNIPTNEMDPDDWYEKNDKVNPAQFELLHNLLKDEDDLKERMLKWAGVKEIEDIPASKIKSVIKTVNTYMKDEKEEEK